jgi:hypothetical protein
MANAAARSMRAYHHQILIQGQWAFANIAIQLFVVIKDKLTLLKRLP